MASKTVILVHGGFVDGSGWRGVYDILRKDGYDVSVVQNPTLSLEGDVAATKRIIDAQGEPVASAAVACFRWACNKRLRDAFCTLADSTRHWHPWAADHYARSIQHGHDHQRAIRTLGRAWCRLVWQCWQSRTPYDPARHRALQRHITVTIPTSSGPVVDLAATQRIAASAFAPNAEQTPPDNKKVTAAQ